MQINSVLNFYPTAVLLRFYPVEWKDLDGVDSTPEKSSGFGFKKLLVPDFLQLAGFSRVAFF